MPTSAKLAFYLAAGIGFWYWPVVTFMVVLIAYGAVMTFVRPAAKSS